MTQTTHPSTDLYQVLVDVGVDVTRVGEREISGRCPVHLKTTGHEDRSPSWSINIDSGLWICFSCGARGSLSYLLYELVGDSGTSAQMLLVDAGMRRLVKPVEDQQEDTYVNKDDFFKFSRVSDKKCIAKNLDPDLAFKYGVRWDVDNKAWVLPIVSSMGQLMGWQLKKSGWVRNRPNGVQKGKTLFGVERFRSGTAVLVESPLDVVRFAGVQLPAQALASFGAYVTTDQIRLLTHTCDRVVIAMDNDTAGHEASMRLYKSMTAPRKGILWWNYRGTTAKDIGDMSDEEIQQGYEEATVVPPWMT